MKIVFIETVSYFSCLRFLDINPPQDSWVDAKSHINITSKIVDHPMIELLQDDFTST
jgi:hypothetical protein